jgi:hypothetical protein
MLGRFAAQVGPGGTRDRRGDPAAMGEIGVGGIDDHVDALGRDVALDELDHRPPTLDERSSPSTGKSRGLT